MGVNMKTERAVEAINALVPFARAAESYADADPDRPLIVTPSQTITVAHLREALRALLD